MRHSTTWLDKISRSPCGKLLRVIVVAQQLSSFPQVPAVKALSSVGNQSEIVRFSGMAAADPVVPAVEGSIGGGAG